MHNQKNKQIEKIIKKRQRKLEKFLDLNSQKDNWKNVLHYKNWAHLQSLCLDQCGMSDSDVSVLTHLPWPNLKELNMNWNKITNMGANNIWVQQWPNLNSLNIWENKITGFGLQSMRNSVFTKQLIQLSLDNNPIGSKGIKFLTKADLPQLEELRLDNCALNYSGAKHLVKLNSTSLKIYTFHNNNESGDGWCSLPTMNFNKVTYIELSWLWIHVLHLVAMEASKQIGFQFFSNEESESEFEKLIIRMLRVRFETLKLVY